MTTVKSKKTCAFTLTELLVSILIIGIIMGAVLGLFFAIVKHMEQSDDVTTAQQHGESVIYSLKPIVLATALGMSENTFSSNFNIPGKGDLLAGVTDKKPLSISADGKTLTVFYALPSGAIVSGEQSVSSTDAVILVSAIPVGLTSNDATIASSWITFAATGIPLFVKAFSTSSPSITVNAVGSGDVYNMDRVNQVRITKATVSNDHFILEDVTNPLTVPTKKLVEGIVDISFDVQPTVQTFSVAVLCKGRTRFDSVVSEKNIEPFLNIDDEYRHYRLRVVESKWRYRNNAD